MKKSDAEFRATIAQRMRNIKRLLETENMSKTKRYALMREYKQLERGLAEMLGEPPPSEGEK